MFISTVVGARPQFIKAAVVSHAFDRHGVREDIVHTGQHYDDNMSAVFFDELGIPAPATNLEVGSGSHAQQTATMMTGLETLWQSERPDWVLVYGDTNSTLAAAVTASKMGIPLAHVEAGLRSFNMRMPEEVNRIVTDRLSNWLFCPTQTAVDHLKAEGRTDGVLMTGDVMLDATRFFGERARGNRPLSELVDLPSGEYYLATVHRAENTDDPERLKAIFDAFSELALPVVLPLHPRTRSRLTDGMISENVRLLDPVPYLSMLTLASSARKVLTDSGGLQKEAVWLGTPCVTMRDETEWVETLEGGWNHVVGASTTAILEAAQHMPADNAPRFGHAAEGTASELIVRTLLEASGA